MTTPQQQASLAQAYKEPEDDFRKANTFLPTSQPLPEACFTNQTPTAFLVAETKQLGPALMNIYNGTR
jgi:hypothetical protein